MPRAYSSARVQGVCKSQVVHKENKIWMHGKPCKGKPWMSWDLLRYLCSYLLFPPVLHERTMSEPSTPLCLLDSLTQCLAHERRLILLNGSVITISLPWGLIYLFSFFFDNVELYQPLFSWKTATAKPHHHCLSCPKKWLSAKANPSPCYLDKTYRWLSFNLWLGRTQTLHISSLAQTRLAELFVLTDPSGQNDL